MRKHLYNVPEWRVVMYILRTIVLSITCCFFITGCLKRPTPLTLSISFSRSGPTLTSTKIGTGVRCESYAPRFNPRQQRDSEGYFIGPLDVSCAHFLNEVFVTQGPISLGRGLWVKFTKDGHAIFACENHWMPIEDTPESLVLICPV